MKRPSKANVRNSSETAVYQASKPDAQYSVDVDSEKKQRPPLPHWKLYGFRYYKPALQTGLRWACLMALILPATLHLFYSVPIWLQSSIPRKRRTVYLRRVVFSSWLNSARWTSESPLPLFHFPNALSEEALQEGEEHSFGGLDLRFFRYDDDEIPRRSIYYDERLDYTHQHMRHWDPETDYYQEEDPLQDDVDFYYNYDDDVARNPLIGYDDDTIQDKRLCRRTSWHRHTHLTCNRFHELDVPTRFYNGETSFLGKGHYREAYLSRLTSDQTVIFKAFKWDADFETEDYEYMRIDALVAEMFTWSPKIISIYGYCGTSMINEAVLNGRVVDVAMGQYDTMSDDEIYKIRDKEELQIFNNLTATEKLQYALEMAEAVALLHSHQGGVIVHDDISIEQFLIAQDGSLKLNDFNRAEFMLFDEENQLYCRYKNGWGGGWWRAPEEYMDDPLDEKIDVWSAANNFFTLLTGLPVYFDYSPDLLDPGDVIKAGNLTWIDPRLAERSLEEKALVDIIAKCWEVNVDKRPSMFDVVAMLREAKTEIERLRSTITQVSQMLRT